MYGLCLCVMVSRGRIVRSDRGGVLVGMGEVVSYLG